MRTHLPTELLPLLDVFKTNELLETAIALTLASPAAQEVFRIVAFDRMYDAKCRADNLALLGKRTEEAIC